MNIHSLGFRFTVRAASLAAVMLAATSFAQQPPASTRPPATGQSPAFHAEELAEITATVTSIDAAKRLISLKTEDGREVTVEAGADVRNFSQIKVGDDVDVQFYRALAAEVTKATASADDAAVVLASRAAAGERPGGGVGVMYTALVTIDSIDAATSTVSFTGAEGKQREVTAERAEGKAFISQLKPGDRVQVTYGEALAIAVAPSD